ncbi:33490_t:CDS:2, partial [Racocetra persica]
ENRGWTGPGAAETIRKLFIQDLTNILCAEISQNREFNLPIVNEYDNSLLKILVANVKYILENTVKYKNLLLALHEQSYWKPILVDCFCSSIQKYQYLVNLSTEFIFKIGTYTYHNGNVCNVTYTWYIDEDATKEEPKAKLQYIYKELTNDASAAKSINQSEIDECVKLAFESIVQKTMIAVNERRHNPIVHLAQ